ncbi:hypothetical protein CDAR_370581 [Caerostris darwini]|uniref:Uncharacterized protein n=1 Tax=Caerostris darwini TaxID=1538125 RepID=A0AAV4TCJ8_9ARAC|nr:hypothetical protein CDAR_370581 [Caerostris darwini]
MSSCLCRMDNLSHGIFRRRKLLSTGFQTSTEEDLNLTRRIPDVYRRRVPDVYRRRVSDVYRRRVPDVYRRRVPDVYRRKKNTG